MTHCQSRCHLRRSSRSRYTPADLPVAIVVHHPIEADHTEEADQTGTQVEVLHADTGHHIARTGETPHHIHMTHITLTNPKPSSDTDNSISQSETTSSCRRKSCPVKSNTCKRRCPSPHPHTQHLQPTTTIRK